MKKLWMFLLISGVFVISNFFVGSLILAQEKGPPAEMIKAAYRQILADADKSGGGKLSSGECTSISNNKKKIEKDCKYWDADCGGNITEEECVNRVRNIMR